jgi:chromate transporter
MTDIPAAKTPARPSGHGIPLSQALRVWLRIALLSFGGPAGQIAMMHRVLVEELRWIGETRFLHALNYCMLLPGPEAQQLTVYIGWLMHRTLGGLIAGVLFVMPGIVSIMVLSWIYAGLGNVPLVAALFFGLKAAVLAIVLQAVVRLGTRALKNGVMVGIAVAAFAAIFLFDMPFPLIVLGAGVTGFIGGRLGLQAFQGAGGHASAGGKPVADAETLLGEGMPEHARPTLAWSLKISAICLVLWFGPILLLGLSLGWDSVYAQIALFFSKVAVVTFGGAYAVLAYVAHRRSRIMAGSSPARCWTVWAWPRRRRGR